MPFLEQLHHEILIGDGAIGTMLYAKGIPLDANFEHLNLVQPELVRELHRDYVAAGAQVIETNTFGANALKLGAIGIGHKVAAINRRGAELARDAAGVAAYVAGSVGPLPRLRGDERELSPESIATIFREQLRGLVDGGVDLFILETFSDLDHLQIAVTVAREFNLPIVASMAYLEGGRTASGADVATAVRVLTAAGADLLGVNCGAGPLEVIRTLEQLADLTDLPLSAYANSGFPEYVDGRSVYLTTPEYFAERSVEMAAAGAHLIGGCCGTTPAHIRQLHSRLHSLTPTARKARTAATPAPANRLPSTRQAGFLADWGKCPVVTVELDPPKGLDVSRVLAGSRALRDAGALAINLAENPLARVRMGNIALAHRIQQELGIDVIVHITCRDRNLLGLQSELMGASLLGIRHILAVTGDPARLGDQADASSVFDLNSFGLLALADGLNHGVNALGNSIGTGTGFTLGCAFNPNSAKMAVQVERLQKKIAAGAQFVQTQPLYDLERLHEMLALTRDLAIPILPGILPLVSERNCEYLHNEVPGIVIPEPIRQRMRGKEKEAGIAEGMAIAREFIAASRSLVNGYYLIPPFGKYELAVALTQFILKGTP